MKTTEIPMSFLLCIGGPLHGEKLSIPCDKNEMDVYDDDAARRALEIDPWIEEKLPRTRYRRGLLRFEGAAMQVLVVDWKNPQDILWKIERMLWKRSEH